jgi:hypothetical protein
LADPNADPSPLTTITKGASEWFNASQWGNRNTTAEAGNITELTLTGMGPTQFWQGYYGEITGVLTLDDANNNTLYDWQEAEPAGELYASLATSVQWNDLSCFNDSGSNNYASVEAVYDISLDDPDGINETFNQTDHPLFYIGDDAYTGCPSTWLYVNSNWQTSDFAEILLENDTNNITVFAVIIENRHDGNTTDPIGFDGVSHDFQMIVPENGTNSNEVVTVYNFWAQLQ